VVGVWIRVVVMLGGGVAVVVSVILGIAVVEAAAETDDGERGIGDQRVARRRVGVRVGMIVVVAMRVVIAVVVIVGMERRPGQAVGLAEGLIAA